MIEEKNCNHYHDDTMTKKKKEKCEIEKETERKKEERKSSEINWILITFSINSIGSQLNLMNFIMSTIMIPNLELIRFFLYSHLQLNINHNLSHHQYLNDNR